MLILWTWNMPKYYLYLLNWLLRSHWTRPTRKLSRCSAPSFLHRSMSFLSAVATMLLVLCPILTIALSFLVCGKCSFTWTRWCNGKGVDFSVWRPNLSLGAINYSVSLGKALGCPRFIASFIKRGLYSWPAYLTGLLWGSQEMGCMWMWFCKMRGIGLGERIKEFKCMGLGLLFKWLKREKF